MLEKINIKNFLSIENNQELKVSNKVTTLIGGNAVGKSSILRAIEKLNGLTIKGDEKNININKQETSISGKFRLNKESRKKLNKKYISKYKDAIIKYPEKDVDIFCTVSVKDDGVLNYEFVYDNEEQEKFDFIDYSKKDIILSVKKVLDEQGTEISKELKDKILKQLETTDSINECLSILNEDEKTIISTERISKIEYIINEIKEKKFEFLIPKFKFIYLNSFKGLLVDEISFSDVAKNNTVKNFLNIAGITIEEIISASNNDNGREITTMGNQIIDVVTSDFKRIFTQADNDDAFQISMQIDTKNNKLLFWIKNRVTKSSVIKFSEESEGIQWYLSMYLLLHEYFEKSDEENEYYFLLIDEPNIYLHASAQIDLLNNVFKQKLNDVQIIYTTHSPYMIDAEDLYSLRIIYKDKQTEIFNTTIDYMKRVSKDSKMKDVDVLSPVLLATGLNISNQIVLSKSDKIVVVEGPHDHYMMSAMSEVLKRKVAYKFIPCTGAGKVPFMCGYLYGIGYKVTALVDDDADGNKCFDELSYGNENFEMLTVIKYNKKIDKGYIGCILEDLFSENDKKKYMEEKSTPNYRSIYNNRKTIKLEESTIQNFENIFDQLDRA